MISLKSGCWSAAGACWAAIAAATPVLAADLPVKAPVASAPMVYNWTGIYGGLHLGYGYGMKDWAGSSAAVFEAKGFLGGGQIGANQQIGNWVIGIEADASWSGIKGGQTQTFGGAVINAFSISTTETKVDRIVTLAGRLGFAQDRWLVYAKFGAAWLHENHSLSAGGSQLIPPLTLTVAAAGSENRFGPMIGFGSEYAFWGNWSIKSEYNYVRAQTGSFIIAGTQTTNGVPAPLVNEAGVRQDFHLAKIGLNYRFGPEGALSITPSRLVPGFDWTGTYVGVQGGYGAARKDWTTYSPNGTFDTKGWIGGATIGTNAQAGVFVAGVESDWLWTGIKGDTTFPVVIVPGTQTTTLSSKFDWISTASARAGFVAADRWLVYFKGGVALAHEQHDFGSVLSAPGVGSATINLTGSAYHTGLLAGVGLEHAFLGNWSAKLEYNYIAFASQNVSQSGNEFINIPGTAVGGFALSQKVAIREDLHLVKVGLNYHFNSFVDVVRARY